MVALPLQRGGKLFLRTVTLCSAFVYLQVTVEVILCDRVDDSVIQQKTSDDVFARLTSSLAQESDPDM